MPKYTNKSITKKTSNKLNLSLASRKHTKHTKHTKHNKDLYLHSHSQEYPFYKNAYKLNLSRITHIIKTMKQQLYIYTKPPNNYKGYPAHKFKTLDIGTKQIGKQQQNRKQQQNQKQQYYIIKSAWNDNIELNSLTDYFTEPCRIQCTFKNRQSPLEYWNKNRQSILASLKNKHQQSTIHNLQEEIYIRNKPCNNFRISVCLEVLNLFKPKKWLDISAGWGDRLLSALLYAQLNTQFQMYCGVDPNPCLHPYYQEMIQTFTTTKKANYILIQDGFETAKLPDTKFDLVFSSPPFFDLEIYSKANANSLVKYKGEDGWFNGFLMPSLNKANEYLENDGHLVLYMGESQGTKYIPKMVELMNARMKNIGMFYYTDSVKIREFFCWRKN